MSKELIRCKTCLNDSYDQGISFDERGVCCYCKKYDHDMKNYYYVNKGGNLKFNRKIEEIKRNRTGKYDCIIGLSGGVDSSYLAYILKEYDLNVLAVHVDAGWNTELSVSNIQKIIDYTNFDLETIVIDWDEIRRLQLACLRAEIMNQDIPQDHAFFSSLYNYAKKENIKYVLTGSNMQTEGILGYYGHSAMDSRYLKDVFKKYGDGKLRSYPTISFLDMYFIIPFIYKIRIVKPFNYLGYNKEKAAELLRDKVGYKVYKYKHGESVWTRFFQDYLLVKKFSFDKRKTHLSSQIKNHTMQKSSALKILSTPAYDMQNFEFDCDYISRKLEIDTDEFVGLLKKVESDNKSFKSNEDVYKTLKFFQKIIERITGKSISNYS